MNPKNILLLSGASVALLAPPAIANQLTEAIPDPSPAPAMESELQTPEPIVVEVQVAEPEQIVEAIAPVALVPTVSSPESFAPDFSASPVPVPEAIAPTSVETLEASAIAPTSPELLETEVEPVPVVDRASEVVSSSSEELLEQDEKLDESVATVTEANPTGSPATFSEAIESIGTAEASGLTEELDDSAENAELEAIDPDAESSNEQSDHLPTELPNELSGQLNHESDSELPHGSLDRSESEWVENPRLYGSPEAETDLIDRLAQDDLDHWTPDQWIDLLLSEDDSAEEDTENGNDSSADPEVSGRDQEAELSQTQLEAAEQPGLQRNISLDPDLRLPQSAAPQTLNSVSADNNSDTSFDDEAETAPRYRLVVDDRFILNVKPYRFNWISPQNSDSIRKQKLRGRSPTSSPTSQTGVNAGISFNLQISDRAQFQFAYGAQNADDLESKSKTTPSVHSVTKTPIPVQDVKAGQIGANKLVKTNSLMETIETDLVARVEPVQGSNTVRLTTSPSTFTNESISTARKVQLVIPKTEKTSLPSEFSKPAFHFNRSFEWRITPTVVLNTWGGLTVNPLPPNSPILSLTYLFYLGFPDPLDREGDRLVFMAGQPSRVTEGRK